MLPFISEHMAQSASYLAYKRNKKYGYTPEEKEVLEAAYKAEYGDDYIEDEPVSMQDLKDCLTRINNKEHATV